MAHDGARDELAEAVVEREARLRGDRATEEALWQSVATYVIPRKATFTEEVSPGVERNRQILDSTAPRSLELFASFLHTLLNNPSVRWFRIAVKGRPDLETRAEVKKYLEDVELRMLDQLNSQSANLYAHLHNVYLDLGAFGTAVLFVEWPDGRLRVRAYHLNDVVVDENVAGFVDSVYRQFEPTVRQVLQRWPEATGRKFENLQRNPKRAAEKVRMIHAVFPTTDQIADKLPEEARRAPFASVWVNAEDRKTVQAAEGFEEFPYMVPRWYKTRGTPYGRSPAMTVLPDIRMTNRMMETILRGAEKLVDPPWLLPDGGLVSPLRLFPGGITFADGNVRPEPLIPPGASRIEVGDALLRDRQQAIRDGFFVPLFVTPDSPVKTATQVLQEVDERNRAISPMLIRTQAELFHRLIVRVFKLMERNGLMPTPPAALEDATIDIQYVSPLNSSRLQLEALGTLRVVESLLPWAQIDPGVFDKFDPDKVAEVVQAGSGAPAAIMRDDRSVRQVREARQQQQAQEKQLGQLVEAVEAGAKVGTAQAAQTRARKA